MTRPTASSPLRASLVLLLLALAAGPAAAQNEGEAPADTSELSPLQRLLQRAKSGERPPRPEIEKERAPLPAGVRQLTTSAGEESSPCWAPDGSIYFGLRDRKVQEIHRLDLASGETTLASLPMESASEPNISPDGKYMAFVRNVRGMGSKTFVMRLDDSEQAKLTPVVGRDQESNPVWSRSGGTIYFSLSREAAPFKSAMSISREGENMQDLGGGIELEGDSHASPHMSPDGRRVGWVVRHGHESFLRLMDTKISSLVEEVRVPERFFGDFDWLPDGRRVVVSYLDLNQPREGYSLGILDLESGELEPWLDLSRADGQPAVSPDGKSVVFRSKWSGNGDLYLAELP